MDDSFLYGNIKKIDLHGLTREEALSEIIYEVQMADRNIDGLAIIHGYHGGRVLKDLVRKEFNNDRIEKKVFVNASVTVYKLKKD